MRIAAICVIEPIAFAKPLRAANVPNHGGCNRTYLLTTSTPRRPVAGLMFFFIAIVLFRV